MHCGAVYVKTWLSAKKDLKPFTSQRWPSWEGQLHVWWYKVFICPGSYSTSNTCFQLALWILRDRGSYNDTDEDSGFLGYDAV